MQKKSPVNPQPLIFYTADEQVCSAIKEDSICLHANVFTNSNMTQEIRLAMTNFYLAICSPHSQFSDYLYYADL